MPKRTYARCRNCGRHRNEAGEMTHSRLCIECSLVILEVNARSISAKEGTPYLRQVARQYLAARKVLLDAGLLSS